MTDIEGAVLEIIAAKSKAEPGTLSRQTELSTLTLDSLDVVEMIFQIEEKFDISIPYNANEAAGAEMAFKTAGDIIDLVGKHIAEQKGA